MLLASEDWARERRLPVLAYLRAGKSWAVDFASGKEGLLMAPAYAVSAMLEDVQLSLQDFDYYEIHEAFAAQMLCTLRAWESPEFCRERLGRSAALGSIPPGKINVKGGSVALGHPFAATGGRILAALAKLLGQRCPGAARPDLGVHGRGHGCHRRGGACLMPRQNFASGSTVGAHRRLLARGARRRLRARFGHHRDRGRRAHRRPE